MLRLRFLVSVVLLAVLASLTSLPSAEAIADEFVRRGTIQGLDTSCLSQVKPKPFLVEPPAKGVSPFG